MYYKQKPFFLNGKDNLHYTNYPELNRIFGSSLNVLTSVFSARNVQVAFNELVGFKEELFLHTKKTLGCEGQNHPSYFDWAVDKPSRAGFSFPERVAFWAATAKGLPAVPFLMFGEPVLPLAVTDDKIYAVNLYSGVVINSTLPRAMPLFPIAVFSMLQSKDTGVNKEVLRNAFQVIAQYGQERDNNLTEQALKQEREVVAQSWDIENTKVHQYNTLVNETVLKDEFKQESKEMKNTDQLKRGMVEVNKEALTSVAYLNAGRASNKLIKEAVRPLLNAMFKPTFMQRIAMKLFKMENPVDVALKSSLSDLACAQLAQAIVEIRGVENEYVREVTKAGITQAGYELSKAIPFEQAVDELVSKLEGGAEGIVSKLSKK